ncbi:glycoside hydrolase family 3, putative [Bodo saltans]|uniref:Glycoside hydrolase family 3, putative n=1 Tax=Bodo saltans TaxID=75058 RepID=A0A0S4INM3_BODSA|nr:glycoside hydrolase family 3, putative [Bodo saltans]|eukprot:CUF69598.1 glycoside hydrolase family 3, putative [Bodo saltans]
MHPLNAASLLAACALLLIFTHTVDGTVVPAGVACGDPTFQQLPFCNVSLAIPDRVTDLINRIREVDKPALLTARGWPQGNVTSLAYLGVPGYDWGLNCVHGVQSTCVNDTCPTSFPNPNGLGATWNMSNVQWMGMKIGLEARALWRAGAREPSLWSGMAHIGLNCWSPNININRDPRWGRNQEVPSEDPLLAGDYAKAYTEGIQRNPSMDRHTIQAIVTLKHWAAYSLDDSDGVNRYNFNAVVSEYDLSDTYLRAFHAGIVEGQAKGVMCSYNSLNGIPTCASPFLKDKLRGSWNFTGYVTSDTDSVQCIYQDHQYTLSPANASCLALHDGETDINSGGTYFTYLAAGVEEGLCSQTDVDRALRNTMTLRFELGLFDGALATPPPFWNIPMSVVNDDMGKAQSLFSSQQSLVLLQNRNATLPLVKTKSHRPSDEGSLRVGWIGPSANSSSVMLGNYLGWLCPGGMNDFSCVAAPLKAFVDTAAQFNVDVTVSYAQGCYHASEDAELMRQALEVAASSDVIVFLGGLDESLEAEMLDRTSIALPTAQLNLLKNISAAAFNVPKVLVLFNGGVVGIEEALPIMDSVVEAWYPGPYGGAAVATALLGAYNPGGKLPVTMYPSAYVDMIQMSDMNMTTGVGRSYRYLSPAVAPIFPFGFGISYTTFSWDCVWWTTGGGVGGQLDCIGTNTGDKHGDDVVQLYVTPPTTPLLPTAPRKSLVNYTRVHIDAGKSVPVSFVLNGEAFCFTTPTGTRVAVVGEYVVRVENGGEDGWNNEVRVSLTSSPTCTQI